MSNILDSEEGKALYNNICIALIEQANNDCNSGDYAAAAVKLRKLVDLGVSDAAYDLGRMYDEGIGVTQSDEEAFRLYLIAASNGHAGAMNNLAVCYKTGQGCTQSVEKAMEWYKRAAEADLPDAIVNYANNLLQIYLVTKDKMFLIEANEWAMKGMRKGIQQSALIFNQIHKYWELEF